LGMRQDTGIPVVKKTGRQVDIGQADTETGKQVGMMQDTGRSVVKKTGRQVDRIYGAEDG